MNNSASLRQSPRGFGRSLPESAGRLLEIIFGVRPADPRGTGRSQRGSAAEGLSQREKPKY